MIDRDHPQLSVRKQCELLDVNRNRLEPCAPKRTASDLTVMAAIDSLHTDGKRARLSGKIRRFPMVDESRDARLRCQSQRG